MPEKTEFTVGRITQLREACVPTIYDPEKLIVHGAMTGRLNRDPKRRPSMSDINPCDIEIMIDIETLDTSPSSVVMSVGLAFFTQDCKIIETHRWNLSIDEQLKNNRTVNESTLRFWMEQQPDVLRHQMDLRHQIRCWDFYTRLCRTIKKGPGVWGFPLADSTAKPNIWSLGSFDVNILEHFCEQQAPGKPYPWRFFQARDLRTLREECGIGHDFRPESSQDLSAHDPVDDCVWQIGVLAECRRRMGASR